MSKTIDWMEVDGRRFVRSGNWWISEEQSLAPIYVYEVTTHDYRGAPPRKYWEAARTRKAGWGDVLVTQSQDLEECCWDAVQVLKNSPNQLEPGDEDEDEFNCIVCLQTFDGTALKCSKCGAGGYCEICLEHGHDEPNCKGG